MNNAAIAPCASAAYIEKTETSGNNEFLASLRAKLTSVANVSQRPLPAGLLASLDNSQAHGIIDNSLYTDIAAYLNSVNNEQQVDISEPDAQDIAKAADRGAGETTTLPLRHKVLREIDRIFDQAQNLNKAKIEREFKRIADQLLGEGGRLNDKIKELNSEKVKREADRIKDQVTDEIKRMRTKWKF